MSVVFSGRELLDISIGIEKQGIAYYDIMARSTKQQIARDLFNHLADAERVHAETFRNFVAETDDYNPPQNQLNEYSDYMRALVNNAVFTNEMATSELATHIDSEIEAVDIGISAEKDSILFYYFLKEVIPAAGIKILDKILSEEKLHLSQLNGLKKKMLEMKNA